MQSTGRALERRLLSSRWLVSTLLFAGLSLASSNSQATEVRVRMTRLKDSISVSGMGLRFPGSASRGFAPFQALKIKWTPGAGGVHSWTVVDRDTGALIAKFRARSLEMAGLNMRVNLKPAPERVALVPPSKGAGVDLIARMDLEEYLKGVLPSEMPAGWPLEALKAQAVAARTYALYRRTMRERAGSAYHLESTVMDQVFFMPIENDPKRANVERAIRETAGVVLRDAMKRPFATYFHADCGGHTEEAQNVWSGEESQGTAVDDACPMNPMARWTAKLSLDKVTSRLRVVAGVGPALALNEIVPVDRSKSGRVERVQLKWNDGSESSLTGHQFRMAVGFNEVRSTNFSLAKSGRDLILRGLGFGHGVGLCQWGARHLAMSGKGFREILRHYYPKARLDGAETEEASQLTADLTETL